MPKRRAQSPATGASKANVAKALQEIERALERPEFARPVRVMTATELAEMLHLKPRTVQKRAQALGAARVGRVFLLTPEQAAQIRAELEAPGKRGPKPHSRSTE